MEFSGLRAPRRAEGVKNGLPRRSPSNNLNAHSKKKFEILVSNINQPVEHVLFNFYDFPSTFIYFSSPHSRNIKLCKFPCTCFSTSGAFHASKRDYNYTAKWRIQQTGALKPQRNCTILKKCHALGNSQAQKKDLRKLRAITKGDKYCRVRPLVTRGLASVSRKKYKS